MECSYARATSRPHVPAPASPTAPDPLPATPEAAARVAAVLTTGGVALVPAEGVYGLSAAARRPDALARVRQLKGRGPRQPLLVLTARWADVAAWVEGEIPPPLAVYERAPEAVTVLLPASGAVPRDVTGPERLVGVRVTADAFGQALVQAAGEPLASTSANPTGEPAPSRYPDVAESIRARVDVRVDGGERAGAPSTMVRWTGEHLAVVREGAVDPAAIAAATGLEVR